MCVECVSRSARAAVRGEVASWFVVDACCLLSMQSFRKVPKVTKIKDGRVARADLKASERDRVRVSKRESCEIFYVPARHWSPLIYAT